MKLNSLLTAALLPFTVLLTSCNPNGIASDQLVGKYGATGIFRMTKPGQLDEIALSALPFQSLTLEKSGTAVLVSAGKELRGSWKLAEGQLTLDMKGALAGEQRYAIHDNGNILTPACALSDKPGPASIEWRK